MSILQKIADRCEILPIVETLPIVQLIRSPGRTDNLLPVKRFRKVRYPSFVEHGLHIMYLSDKPTFVRLHADQPDVMVVT